MCDLQKRYQDRSDNRTDKQRVSTYVLLDWGTSSDLAFCSPLFQAGELLSKKGRRESSAKRQRPRKRVYGFLILQGNETNGDPEPRFIECP